jgi:hypothetical protein
MLIKFLMSKWVLGPKRHNQYAQDRIAMQQLAREYRK